MRHPFGEQQLLLFELHDLRFERSRDGGNGRLDDPLDGLVDLLLDFGERGGERLALVLRVRLPAVPQLAEHGGGNLEELRLRLRMAQHRLELALDHIAPDGLAVGGAAFLRALVIGVPFAVLAAARGPAGREEAVAVVAMNEAAQREIDAEVRAVGRPAKPCDPLLNTLERGEADQRLVMAFSPRDMPLRGLYISGINAIAQHVADTLMRQHARLRFRVERMRVQEFRHIGLHLEAA